MLHRFIVLMRIKGRPCPQRLLPIDRGIRPAQKNFEQPHVVAADERRPELVIVPAMPEPLRRELRDLGLL